MVFCTFVVGTSYVLPLNTHMLPNFGDRIVITRRYLKLYKKQ